MVSRVCQVGAGGVRRSTTLFLPGFGWPRELVGQGQEGVGDRQHTISTYYILGWMHAIVTPVPVERLPQRGLHNLSTRAPIETILDPLESSRGADANAMIGGCSRGLVGITRAALKC